MRSAEIWAVSSLGLTNVVESAVPFHWIVELETKFEPFAVIVKAWPPRVTVLGEIAVKEGVGFSGIVVEGPPLHPAFTNISTAVAKTLTRSRILTISGIALPIMTTHLR